MQDNSIAAVSMAENPFEAVNNLGRKRGAEESSIDSPAAMMQAQAQAQIQAQMNGTAGAGIPANPVMPMPKRRLVSEHAYKYSGWSDDRRLTYIYS